VDFLALLRENIDALTILKTMKNEHKILHFKFVNYGANAKEWMRKCVLLLPEIAKHRIWEQKGFGSIYEYAAKLAGMSRNTVDDALRILHRIEDKPDLQQVVESKGLNAVRPIVAIVTPETAQFWAEKARIMSKNTLEAYVKEFRTSTENNAKNPQQQAIVTMELDAEVAEQLQKLKGQGDWNELMKQLLQMRASAIEQQKPEPVKTESRHVPVKIQRYISARTNGTCSYPGCVRPAEILHHTERFALEKTHDPDHLHGLCKQHERIAHHGLIENEESAPSSWKIKKEPDQFAPKFRIDELVGKYMAR